MILQPVFVRHVPRRRYVWFCRVMVSVIAVAAVIVVGSVAAYTQEVVLAFGALAGFRLFLVALVVLAAAAGFLAFAKTIESVHASGKRDSHAIFVTGLLVVLGWFTAGLLLIVPAIFEASSSHTRIDGVAGHAGLLISETSWDETNLSVYQGNGILLHPVRANLPLAAPGFHPIASGAYSLRDTNGVLVLEYATSSGGSGFDARVVIG